MSPQNVLKDVYNIHFVLILNNKVNDYQEYLQKWSMNVMCKSGLGRIV